MAIETIDTLTQKIADRILVLGLLVEVQQMAEKLPTVPCKPSEMTKREKEIYLTTLELAKIFKFLVDSLVTIFKTQT